MSNPQNIRVSIFQIHAIIVYDQLYAILDAQSKSQVKIIMKLYPCRQLIFGIVITYYRVHVTRQIRFQNKLVFLRPN